VGVELHIQRKDGAPISSEQWLAYVADDPELTIDPEWGPHFAIWAGPSKYETPWLDLSHGRLSTKWPDTALFRKMLDIAQLFDAEVRDDDGTLYLNPNDWSFDPDARRPR